MVKKVRLHCCVCGNILRIDTDERVNGDSTVVCVVISSLHTDEGVNGDSTVVLEVTSPEDLEDFN